MTIDNDARREVALQLNHYAYDELEGVSLLKTLKAVTGATSWRGCLAELAMLIKPHECHMELDHRGYDYEYWRCSRCGEVHEMPETGGYCPFAFCPDCGAEVVDDD